MVEKKKEGVTLQKLQESVASDVLTDAVSDEEVDSEIRQAGGDPDAIARRGLAMVQELLDRRRLAWQQKAAEKLASVRTRKAVDRPPQSLTKEQLLARIDELRQDSTAGAPIEAAFRKRKPEESTVEELTELLDEVEMLRELAAEDTDSKK